MKNLTTFWRIDSLKPEFIELFLPREREQWKTLMWMNKNDIKKQENISVSGSSGWHCTIDYFEGSSGFLTDSVERFVSALALDESVWSDGDIIKPIWWGYSKGWGWWAING